MNFYQYWEQSQESLLSQGISQDIAESIWNAAIDSAIEETKKNFKKVYNLAVKDCSNLLLKPLKDEVKDNPFSVIEELAVYHRKMLELQKK